MFTLSHVNAALKLTWTRPSYVLILLVFRLIIGEGGREGGLGEPTADGQSVVSLKTHTGMHNVFGY